MPNAAVDRIERYIRTYEDAQQLTPCKYPPRPTIADLKEAVRMARKAEGQA